MSAALLTVQEVHAGYLPGIDILRGLSLQARPNEITLVIGPNGAGKSTLLRTVFAFLPPTRGTIMFRGSATAGLRPSGSLGPTPWSSPSTSGGPRRRPGSACYDRPANGASAKRR